MSPGSRARRASHIIARNNPRNSYVRWKRRVVAERERGREYENGLVPIPFTQDKRRVSANGRRRRWKARLRNRRAEFQNEERAVVGQWKGKQFPTVLDQAGRRGMRRGKGKEGEDGSQLSGNVSSDSSFLFAPNGSKSERV